LASTRELSFDKYATHFLYSRCIKGGDALRRFLIPLIVFFAFGMLRAQEARPQPGDPPNARLISVEPPDDDGVVTIIGQPGAVFDNARVAIRNLYTQETVFTQAGPSGGFSAKIYGPGNTPFWISPTSGNISQQQREFLGSMPGGPGTILYGEFPQTPREQPPITRLIIDGETDDWAAYPEANLATVDGATLYGLRNRTSLYVAISGVVPPPNYTRFEVIFTIDTVTYGVAFDPRASQVATLTRLNPDVRELGTLTVATHQSENGIEVRIPLTFLTLRVNAILDRVRFLDRTRAELAEFPIRAPLPQIDEEDAIYRAQPLSGADLVRFDFAGRIFDQVWTARGRTTGLHPQPGDTWRAELDMTLETDDLPPDATLIGRVRLQPFAVQMDDAVRPVPDRGSNNGWSNVLTPSGLAVDNLSATAPFAETVIESYQLVRREDSTDAAFTFALTIPENLRPGLYVPVFEGFVGQRDGDRTAWSSERPGRLPLVLNIGGVEDVRLLWSLFVDNPSDGARGILAEADKEYAALSGRVRFNPPTYILPPTQSNAPVTYSLEPYLLEQLPNLYTATSPPLIPFAFPSGELSVQVTRPDGTVTDLGTFPVLQNQVSTAAQDERTLFGAQSPVDIYRVTTLNPALSRYNFVQYGEHTITLSGTLEDTWGNRYSGGGEYRVLIAESLKLLPAALSGTPFQVGDALNVGVHVAPNVPAEITVTVRVYPLDNSEVIEQTFTGRANANGIFQPARDHFVFTTPGEYVVDYEARYGSADGRLWAASLRSAGVIGEAESPLVAHGARGFAALDDNRRLTSRYRLMWFDAEPLAGTDENLLLNAPYFSGDVAWVSDEANSGIRPVLRVQDLTDAYHDWVLNALSANTRVDGVPLAALAREDELPLPVTPDGSAYGYISAVRPGVAVRQFINGGRSDSVASADGGLPLYWDTDDPYNRQIGAGLNGDQPGDYIFIFGGAVTHVDDVQHSAIYGALAVITEPEESPGMRVGPPGRGADGGADGGALMVVDNAEVDLFFVPTGARPGDLYAIGDTLAISGQVAPPLASNVSVVVTSPSGVVRAFEGVANPIGYFYDPSQNFTFDEPGLWTIDIQVSHEGRTSAGQIEPPPLRGGVLGADDAPGVQHGRFAVYVLPVAENRLPWNAQLQDSSVPAASPYNFNFTLPQGWTNIRAFYTLTTPATILDAGELRINGRSISYAYNPTQLARRFPNLETDTRVSGPFVSDVRTLTIYASGTDENGQQVFLARTFTIFHDHLFSLE
jgi:hypothetical protein